MRAPIEVMFGEKKYEIKPLRILKSVAWRKALIIKMAEVAGQLQQITGSDAAFLKGLGYTLIQFPDILCDLVFQYATDLPREEVMHEDTGATEEQMAVAFGKILQVAFPFQGELKTVLMLLRAPANSPV